MSFQRFCQDNRIPKCYYNCKIDDLTTLKPIAEKFLELQFPMMLYGEPGVGKTYTMLALIRELLESRHYPRSSLRFINAAELDDGVEKEMIRYKSSTHFIQSLQDDHFLFIDDFGIERSKESAERNYYKLLDYRLANQKPTVISTNLKESEVLSIFGARIHSRLKQCINLHITDEDQRKPPEIIKART